ncbi:hypothetical protein L9F63_001946, partial [Diploptera punctata]
PIRNPNFAMAGYELCETELNLPEVKRFIENSDLNFDIVIVETVITPCFLVIPYKLGVPFIGISSLPPNLGVHSSVGNPMHPAYSPDFLLGYTHSLTFLQRIHSTLHLIVYTLADKFWNMPLQDALVRRIFNNISMPNIEDLIKNVSLVLVNSHYSFYYPRPNVLNMVEIGGLHLSTPRPLPKELQDFLDGALEGVIYFSLGTNVKCDTMTAEKRQVFLDVFSALPKFRVLWKWDGDEIPRKPRNVEIAKWFPQQDILAHPNIKLIIYQGGLQSTEEALRAQVPLIGIPFFADQDLNVEKIVNAGAGKRLEFNDITKEVLLNSIKEVVYDLTYKKNMIQLSKITQDQSQTAMERAVWWIEYVIRHKGAHHIRSATVDLTWYQYLLLDVILFLTVITIVIILITYKLSRFLNRNIRYLPKFKFKSH